MIRVGPDHRASRWWASQYKVTIVFAGELAIRGFRSRSVVVGLKRKIDREAIGQGDRLFFGIGASVPYRHLIEDRNNGSKRLEEEIDWECFRCRDDTGAIDVEHEIEVMTRGYNDSVERYNSRLGQFPELLLAMTGDFNRAELVEPDSLVPQVSSV